MNHSFEFVYRFIRVINSSEKKIAKIVLLASVGIFPEFKFYSVESKGTSLKRGSNLVANFKTRNSYIQ